MSSHGIDPAHLLGHVVRPALLDLAGYEPRMHSAAAERLLMLTCAHESHCGRWLVQRGNGPAKGIFQMEDLAASEAEARYWKLRPDNRHELKDRASDLKWAAILCRLYYWPYNKALPDKDDVRGLAQYWHEAWCRGCAGTVDQAVNRYHSLVLSKLYNWD